MYHLQSENLFRDHIPRQGLNNYQTDIDNWPKKVYSNSLEPGKRCFCCIHDPFKGQNINIFSLESLDNFDGN